MTAKEKNRLAGIFLMAHGGFLGLIYLLMIGFLAIVFNSDPGAPGGVLAFFTFFIAVISAVFVAPQIIGGWKMYKEQPNAKTWGIIGSIISCLSFPLGTAVGVYGLWFLFGDQGKQFYENAGNPNYLGAANSVNDFQYNDARERQPHSWK